MLMLSTEDSNVHNKIECYLLQTAMSVTKLMIIKRLWKVLQDKTYKKLLQYSIIMLIKNIY